MSIDPSEARKVAHLARIAVADDALPALVAEARAVRETGCASVAARRSRGREPAAAMPPTTVRN